ncbi:hypothetical protein JXM67_10570 [candidate division WOR-3 bacterium]|nr:hypothetical protein [candidate division WOR-3 bacterium]
MKKILSISAVLVLAAGFVGCEEGLEGFRNPGEGISNFEQDGAGSSPYFPYELGKEWNYLGVYTYTTDYPEGFPGEDTTWTDTTTSITEVIGETQLTGSNPLAVWEIRTISYMKDMEPQVYYSWVHIDGDSVYSFDDISDSEPDMVSPSNPKLGDQWEHIYEVDDTTTDTIHYEVVEEGVEANGYDNCIEIKITQDMPEEVETFEQYQYMAKETGMVLATYDMLTRFELSPGEEIVFTMEGEYKLLPSSGIKE